MSKAQFISADEVVSSAMLATGQSDDTYRSLYLEWCYDAVRSIGLNYINVKTVTLPIEDFIIDKPCDLLIPKDIILLGSNNNLNCLIPFHDTDTFSDLCPSPQAQNYVTIEEMKDFFQLSTNSSSYTKAKLKYVAAPVDENGDIQIPEYYKRACIAFITYMDVSRKRQRSYNKKGHNDVPISDVQYYDNKWMELKAEAAGKRKMPNKMKMDEAMRNWMTLLPNHRRLNRNRRRRFFLGAVQI
jgi:hypothetical protein